MQVGVGSSGKHDPRAGVTYGRWESAVRRVERPKNHPMGPDRDGGARPIRDAGVAMLRGTAKHVAKTRRRIGWPRLSRHRVFEPLHPHLVDAHWGSTDPVLVTRHAHPSVRAIAKHMGDVSVMVHLHHGGISRNLPRS